LKDAGHPGLKTRRRFCNPFIISVCAQALSL
jgi:hypothetical protein